MSKKISFRDQLAELEAITEWFERGDVDLDEGLKKYERGLVLAASCRDRLAQIEQTVVSLQKQHASSDNEQSGTLSV